MDFNQPNFTRSLIGFAQFAREKGLNVGVEETFSTLRAMGLGLFKNKAAFYYSLKALFCCHKDQIPLFDELFGIYWETKAAEGKGQYAQKISNPQYLPKQQSVLSVWGLGKEEGQMEEDSKTVTGGNPIVRLRKTDFSKLTQMDATLLETLAEKLWREMSKRLKRRLKHQQRKETVDLRRTIRANLPYGGENIELRYRSKKTRKLRLLVLLDVSGSMDKYSFFLLRFVLALQAHFEQVESFVFSTHLRRITEVLKTKGLEKTLQQLSPQVDHWSSGTQIGACLREFNERFAPQVLTRSSLVLILSDGLETGEKGVLKAEIQKIRRKTRRLIWLNPLKGTRDYTPTARGMQEALPYIDHFRPAHNLESILELEDLLCRL
jgi:hypothetical protein